MDCSPLNVIAGIAALVIFVAAPAHAGSIQVDSTLACVQEGPICFPIPGVGKFTITNDTSDWAVTGFQVTDDPVPSVQGSNVGFPFSLPTVQVLASTSRTDWSASADNVGVDPSE